MLEKMADVCRNNYHGIMNYPNVVGVGVGSKIINGVDTKQPCLCVLVSKKIAKESLQPKHIIPKSYKNFNTDVIETGEFKLKNCLQEKARPVMGGYCLGPYYKGSVNATGTACCVVTDGTSKYLLTCYHVLFPTDTYSSLVQVLQPSNAFGGTVNDSIGVLSRKFTRINIRGANEVDAALVELNSNSQGLVWPYVEFAGPINGVGRAVVNQSVKMVGCMSGMLKGKITAINASVYLNIDSSQAFFRDQIITDIVSIPGDSGAMLMTDDSNLAVGMLCSGSNTISSFNVMGNVLNSLSVKMYYNPI